MIEQETRNLKERKKKTQTAKTPKRKKGEQDTNHLEGGQVFLPPDELGVLRSHGGHHVVKVHDDVDERVEQTEEGRVAAGRETDAEPDAHRHDAVVDDVQQRDVLVLLAQHEEELRVATGQTKTTVDNQAIDNNDNGLWTPKPPPLSRDTDRVEELGELGEVVPPAGVDHLGAGDTQKPVQVRVASSGR